MAVASPRKSSLDQAYLSVPVDHPNEEEHRRLLAEGTEAALEGKLRSISTFTLAASSLTTVVTDRRVGPKSVIYAMPTSQTAGGEMGIWFSAIGTLSSSIPSFTVNHAFDTRTDRTFRYIVLG